MLHLGSQFYEWGSSCVPRFQSVGLGNLHAGPQEKALLALAFAGAFLLMPLLKEVAFDKCE